ncbi:MAG: outer membrane protein assembly factor BamE, partial [Pseudomonadota bacterium]
MARKAALAGIGLLLAAGCTPSTHLHGFAPPDEVLETVRQGVDTRGSVRRKIGRPSTSGLFTDDGWYYGSTTIERKAFQEPKVVDRKVVAILFDTSDVVASIDTYGLEDGRV